MVSDYRLWCARLPYGARALGKRVVRHRKDHKLRGDRRKWQRDGLWSSPNRVTMALGIGASYSHYTIYHMKRYFQGPEFFRTVGGDQKSSR